MLEERRRAPLSTISSLYEVINMGWVVESGMNWSLTYDKRSTWTVDIPEGTDGTHSIVHYNMENIDSWTDYWKIYNQVRRESPHLRNYTVLLRDDQYLSVMQDSCTEFEEHQWFWGHATGDVLITGLGLGFVNEWLIKAPGITSVTIIEKNQDVIDLVWDHCAKDERFTLIHDDADTWDIPDGSSWDCVWIDHEISGAPHLEELTDKYGPYTTNLGCYGHFKDLENYYEINADSGMLELRDPNIMLPWM